MKYRVWALYAGLRDTWFPVSVPFDSRKQAERWAKSLNTASRVEEEDAD